MAYPFRLLGIGDIYARAPLTPKSKGPSVITLPTSKPIFRSGELTRRKGLNTTGDKMDIQVVEIVILILLNGD